MDRKKFLDDLVYDAAELRSILGTEWTAYRGTHLLLLTEIIFQLARIFNENKKI